MRNKLYKLKKKKNIIVCKKNKKLKIKKGKEKECVVGIFVFYLSALGDICYCQNLNGYLLLHT